MFFRCLSVVYVFLCFLDVVKAIEPLSEPAHIISQAKLCQQSYSLAHDPKACSDETIYPFYSSKKTLGGFIKVLDDKSISVVFKGTSTTDDVVTDLTGWWAVDHITGLRCHQGALSLFQDLYASFQKALCDASKAHQFDIQEVKWFVAGHSLGGGLAQLAAYYLQHKGLKVERVTTFGAFQLFDAPSAVWYDEKLKARTDTIIQENDPVSMVGALDWVNALYVVQALYKSYHTPDALLEISHLLAQVRQPLSSSCHVGQITVLPSQLIPHRMQTFIDHYSHEENDLKEVRPLKRSQAPQTAHAEHYMHKGAVYGLAKANCHPFIDPAKQAQLEAPLVCPVACG